MPAGLWARDAAVGALHLFQPTRRTGTRTIRLPLHRVPDPFSPRRALGPGRLVVLFSLLPLHPRTQTRARTPSRTRDHPRVRSASRAPSTRNLPHPETLLPSVSPCVPTLSLPPHPPRPPPTRLLSSRSLLTNTFLQPHESANPPPPPHKASPSPNSNAQAGNAPRFPALPPSGDYLPFHARRFVVPTSTLRPTLTTTPKHQTAHRQKYPPFRA